jgi:5-oxoprolinase (ATP-hydrolysing)
MARSVRAITEVRGYSTKSQELTSFGSAGGHHACAIARLLGIIRVRIHKYSSVLTAYGMALADVSMEERIQLGQIYSQEALQNA